MAALTELFQQVRNPSTAGVVERIVAVIDGSARVIRFRGSQQTAAGEREVTRRFAEAC
jgi:type I restriction enzyme R subunit